MPGWFSDHVFMGAAQRRLAERGVPIFTYHKIGIAPPRTGDPFLYTSPRQFDAQLARLRRLGFTSSDLNGISGMADNNARRAIITFDDGFRNALELGLDPLARHGFQAIQFLVPGLIGGVNEWDRAKGDVMEPLMDEAQVREWLSAGHLIGSHSMTHRNLRKLDKSEAREEIFSSKKSLEDRFGVAVTHFCYPFGGWNEAVLELVREAGYTTACTVDRGVNTSATPRYRLLRWIPLSSAALMRKIIHRASRKCLGK